MGCHGSKTAQPSKPVAQQAAGITLLKEPVADGQVVKPQESGSEIPEALAKETPMDANQEAEAAHDAKMVATQNAEPSTSVEMPISQDAKTSTVEEASAIAEVATSNDAGIPTEMEAAGATPCDEVSKPAEVAVKVNGEVNGDEQKITSVEALAQNPASPEPEVEAGATKAELSNEGVLADQAKNADLAVPTVVADQTATTKQVAMGTHGGCCSRYCVATELQSEIAVLKD
jgi:hypothetical protein